jgi:hypothetical protein
MRIWRDLPTAEELRNGGLTERRVLDAVTEYHSVRKDSLDNILTRMVELQKVIDACKKSGGLLGKMSKNLMDGSVVSVMKRAKAKKEYLSVLHRHYTVSHPEEILDPSSLVGKLAMAQQTAENGELIGILPRNRLEKLDPIHRTWEQTPTGNTYLSANGTQAGGHDDGNYVQNWREALRNGSCNEPFLIYLEETEHCRDKRVAKYNETVRYYDHLPAKKGESPVWWLYRNRGLMRQWHPTTKSERRFDTQWVTTALAGKGGFEHALAYVFTESRELIAGMHNPKATAGRHNVHHSSFTSGSFIRCAGMIGGRDGRVTYIDGKSGHYAPPVANLKKLVQHLMHEGVFASDAKVEAFDYGAEQFTPAEFMAKPLPAKPLPATPLRATPLRAKPLPVPPARG